jgi:hypothetical protein
VRIPVPPSIAARRRCTSSTVSTAGRRLRCGGRPIYGIHGRLTPGTSRTRNKLVLSAWRCVEGDTGRCIASIVSYASTSGPPSSRGCRWPYHTTKRESRRVKRRVNVERPAVRKLARWDGSAVRDDPKVQPSIRLEALKDGRSRWALPGADTP